MSKLPQMSKQETARFFGCTVDQLNQQYTANAQQLRKMHKKAVDTGKKVNKYTAEQLDEMATRYEKLAAE